MAHALDECVHYFRYYFTTLLTLVVPIIMICLAGIMQAVANALIPTVITQNISGGPFPINYYPPQVGIQNSTYVFSSD
jgi:hypothetical protein